MSTPEATNHRLIEVVVRPLPQTDVEISLGYLRRDGDIVERSEDSQEFTDADPEALGVAIFSALKQQQDYIGALIFRPVPSFG